MSKSSIKAVYLAVTLYVYEKNTYFAVCDTTQVSVIIEGAYFSPFQGPII